MLKQLKEKKSINLKEEKTIVYGAKISKFLHCFSKSFWNGNKFCKINDLKIKVRKNYIIDSNEKLTIL